MMYNIAITTGMAGTAIGALAAVYLYSKDPGRRRRALRLLELLLRR